LGKEEKGWNMSENEFDLKKSEKIGQLYPVLVDAKGNIIDGFHRLEADPNWRKEKIPEIDTEEKLLVARAVSNWHRRQVSREEKESWINALAEIYQKQGLKVRNEKMENEIVRKISAVTTLHIVTVEAYLLSNFKQAYSSTPKREPRVPASQAIQSAIKGISHGDERYAKQLVERHRIEVEEELRPRVEKEIRERIIEKEIKPKIRDELSRDAEFIREVIEKAPEVLPNLPEKTIERAKKLVEPKEMIVQEGMTYTVGEYECPHCKKHYLIKCDGRKDWVE
jgi:hypothetical protein